MTLHLGRKPHVYDARDIRYADVRPAKLTLPSVPPAPWGLGTEFKSGPPPDGWGVMGNGPCDDGSIPADWAAYHGAGDCTCADVGHCIRMEAKASGRPVPSVSTKTVLEQYSAIGSAYEGAGYDLATGANDNGLEIRDVLKYRQATGFSDDSGNRHLIGTYLSLEPGNMQHLIEAVYLFAGVAIGINFPASAMDQFNAGKVWSEVPGMMNSILGGHDVPLVGVPGNGRLTCVTWGRRQVMTSAFFKAVCEEAFCYVDPDRFSQVTGKSWNDFASADLEAYIQLLVGR